MANKYLDDVGLAYFWGKAKAYFLGGTSPDDVADTTNCPKMDGTKTYGTSHILAREDHVHPTDTSRAASSHTHGNITNGGDITATAPTIASGDKLIINDESASKITNGPSFGTDTTKYLRNDGTWATPVGETYSDFIGADARDDGVHGLVPAPLEGEQKHVLFGDGDWWRLAFSRQINSSATPPNITFNLNGWDGSDSNSTFNIGSTAIYQAGNGFGLGLMSDADKSKLDSISMTNGVIDSSVLPSYVDDIVEAYPRSGQTELGSTWLSATSGGSALDPETGKIYVLMGNSTNYSTNDLFRWSGSAFVKLSDGSGVSAMSTSEIDTAMAAA